MKENASQRKHTESLPLMLQHRLHLHLHLPLLLKLQALPLSLAVEEVHPHDEYCLSLLNSARKVISIHLCERNGKDLSRLMYLVCFSLMQHPSGCRVLHCIATTALFILLLMNQHLKVTKMPISSSLPVEKRE